MGLEKAIEHGKEHRKRYLDARWCNTICRCHGGCSWCRDNRLHAINREEERAKQKLKEHKESNE